MENPTAVTLLITKRKATTLVVYAPHNEMVQFIISSSLGAILKNLGNVQFLRKGHH